MITPTIKNTARVEGDGACHLVGPRKQSDDRDHHNTGFSYKKPDQDPTGELGCPCRLHRGGTAFELFSCIVDEGVVLLVLQHGLVWRAKFKAFVGKVFSRSFRISENWHIET
jgi:hypothetical protein